MEVFKKIITVVFGLLTFIVFIVALVPCVVGKVISLLTACLRLPISYYQYIPQWMVKTEENLVHFYYKHVNLC